MTMPGFTAEASLYGKGGFGKATITENTTERVQPALRLTCFSLGVLYEDYVNLGPYGWQMAAFLKGYASGIGCPVPTEG
jgi:hypothetical protein